MLAFTFVADCKMPEWLQEAIRQVPALGVLAFIVWSERKERPARDQVLRAIGQSCHDHSEKLGARYDEVVRECTSTMGATKSVLDQVHNQLVRMNGR